MTKTLERQLKEIEKQINEIINDNLKFSSLFPDSFMRKYTNFSSIDELFSQSGFKRETKKDLAAINEKALDKYIKDNTKYE